MDLKWWDGREDARRLVDANVEVWVRILPRYAVSNYGRAPFYPIFMIATSQ